MYVNGDAATPGLQPDTRRTTAAKPLCASLACRSCHDASNGNAQRCSGLLAVLIAPALQRVYVCERLRHVSGA